jgi:hypothetical protein
MLLIVSSSTVSASNAGLSVPHHLMQGGKIGIGNIPKPCMDVIFVLVTAYPLTSFAKYGSASFTISVVLALRATREETSSMDEPKAKPHGRGSANPNSLISGAAVHVEFAMPGRVARRLPPTNEVLNWTGHTPSGAASAALNSRFERLTP